MKITIFGNGLIGSQLAAHLVAAGHESVALGRRDGIDTTTGIGLSEAVTASDVVVDLTNSPSWADEDVLTFFRSSTRNLLTAEKAAGVRHHVALTIVGADRLSDSGYMRAKLAQEEAIQGGGVPYSIVRSTQFFEFIPGIAEAGTVDGVVHATPGALQPIASADVVSRLAEIVTSAPLEATVEIAGPEVAGIDALARRYFAATGDTRSVVTDPDAGYFGAQLNSTALIATPGAGAWIAPTTLDDWLRSRA